MRRLFDIGEDLIALSDILDDSGGEITPEIAAATESWFAELGHDQGSKLDAYIGLIREFEGQHAVANAEAEQFQRKARSAENQIKRLKHRLKEYLEFTGQSKAQSDKGRIVAIQKNGGKPPLIIDPGTLAETVEGQYQRVVMSIDEEAVREDLARGVELPWARLGDVGNHLRIR